MNTLDKRPHNPIKHSESDNYLCVVTPDGKTSRCCSLCPTTTSDDTILINISKPCKFVMNIGPGSTSRGCDCSKCPPNDQLQQSPRDIPKETDGK